jgi:hypothetical protein
MISFKILVIFTLTVTIGIFSTIPFNDASAITYFPPPLKQISVGVAPENVTCTEGLVIVLKSSNSSPTCIKPSSVEKLIQRGWAIEKEAYMIGFLDRFIGTIPSSIISSSGQ